MREAPTSDPAALSVPRASMEDVARQTAPLVGRDEELRQLLATAAAAARASPGAVLVGGDAGVGKSRLVAELVARSTADGMTVLVGHCVNLPDGGLPYVPFVDALSRSGSASWETLEPHLRGGAPAGEQFGPQQLYDAVVQLLVGLACDGPVLLVLEDLHWADRPSRDLVLYLLNRLRDERIAVVLTYRADDVHRRHPLHPYLAEVTRHPLVQRLRLDPLSSSDIEALVTSCGGRALDAAAIRRIVDRAEGNAFFAEELLEAEQGAPGRSGLPEGLADVLIARLELLGPDAQRVIGVAAVAGRRVDHDLLASVTRLPEDELEVALHDAVARHILVTDPESGGYQFRHALLQEAAYSDLLPGPRVRMHGAYAELLAARVAGTPQVAAELAFHAERSHNLGLALTASIQAADHALSVQAPSEAFRHIKNALQWWSAVPDAAQLTGTTEPELQIQAASAANASGAVSKAIAMLEAACAQIDPVSDPGPAARSYAGLAWALFNDDQDQRALAASERAVELASTLPPSVARAEAHSVHAALLLTVQDVEAKRFAESARTDAQDVGADAVLANVLVTLSRLAEREGDGDTAAAHLTTALELAERSADIAAELRVTFNLAMARSDVGDLPGTLRWTGHSMQRAMATGTSWSAYARESRVIDVITRYLAGDWDEALRCVELSTGRAPADAKTIFRVFGLYPAVGRGLPDVGSRLDEIRRARHPDRFQDAQIAMVSGGCEADHWIWQGEPERAIAVHAETIEYPTRLWGRHYLGRIWLNALALAAQAELAERARLRGDLQAVEASRTAGEALVDNAREVAKLGHPRGGRLGVEGVAWLARAEAEWSRVLGEDDPVVWQAAVAAFDFGYDYEVARSRWRLAEVLIRLGRGDEAAEELASAREVAVRLRAAPLLEAVDGLARRSRIGIGSAAVGSDGLLTPREQDVLALLAQGQTNRQLGSSLFISEKTASVHVSNILGKLGAASRGEAVAIARRRGLI